MPIKTQKEKCIGKWGMFRERERRNTFGEGNDMVVLEAEATLAVEKTLADDVASSIFTPSLRMTTRHYFCISPAYAVCL